MPGRLNYFFPFAITGNDRQRYSKTSTASVEKLYIQVYTNVFTLEPQRLVDNQL